jgi:nucleoside-diphosphate-sugar epimerase
VIHVASPFTGTLQDLKEDMPDPAIEGTLNIVQSAHKADVKCIIITSSFVAVCNLGAGGTIQQKLVYELTEYIQLCRGVA